MLIGTDEVDLSNFSSLPLIASKTRLLSRRLALEVRLVGVVSINVSLEYALKPDDRWLNPCSDINRLSLARTLLSRTSCITLSGFGNV